MSSSMRTWLNRTPDWLMPFGLFLLIALATLGPGAYFLHIDTGTQDVAAVDLLRDCWSYTAATLAPMTFLLLPFALFGPSPVWEMLILSLLGAGMAAAIYRLLVGFAGSKQLALLGILWFISLPVMLYYTRTHLGYALAFFTIGIMFHVNRRYWWAGLAFGLALTSHFNYLIPLSAWFAWSFLTDRDTRRVRTIITIAAGFFAPLLVLEFARWFFTGIPFGWIRGVIDDATRLTGQGASRVSWPVTHVFNLMSFSNGWVNLVLLLTGAGYIAVRKPRRDLLDAVYLTGWSLVGYYSLRVSLLGNTFLTPRMFAAAYPLLVLASVVTLGRYYAKVKSINIIRWMAGLVVMLALPVSLFDHMLDAYAGTATGFDSLERVFDEAAESGLPVRYYGSIPPAIFFAQVHGTHVNTNEFNMDIVLGDQQAVLIFEYDGMIEHAALRGDPRFRSDMYRVTRIPHLSPYRPIVVEQYGITPAVLREFRQDAYAHAPDAHPSDMIVYWPSNPSGEFQARVVIDRYVYDYNGGCTIPPPFDGPDGAKLNYYDLLGEKLREVSSLVRQGKIKPAFELVKQWMLN